MSPSRAVSDVANACRIFAAILEVRRPPVAGNLLKFSPPDLIHPSNSALYVSERETFNAEAAEYAEKKMICIVSFCSLICDLFSGDLTHVSPRILISNFSTLVEGT
jgi:hypothetical protein